MLVRPVRHRLPLGRALSSPCLARPAVSTLPSPAVLLPPSAETRRILTSQGRPRSWRRKSFRALTGFERNLATAVAEHPAPNDMADLGPYHATSDANHTFSTEPLYTSSPISIEESLPLALGKAGRLNGFGIPGDAEEMLSMFGACLQVGRLDRASLILKRLSSCGILSTSDLVELHDRYLHGRVNQLEAAPAADAEDIHRWFELQIRGNDLPHTIDTIIFMLKASLLTSTVDDKLPWHLQRYMQLLPDRIDAATLLETEVLTRTDLDTIGQVLPEYDMLRSHGPPDADEDPTSPPEVLETPQKGSGLRSLKGTLSLFSEMPEGFEIAKLPLAQRREIQARLEKDCVDAAITRWREENEALTSLGVSSTLSNPSLSSRLYDWHRNLERRLAAEVAKVPASESAKPKSQEDLERCLYGPFLQQAKPSRLAAVTILSTLSFLSMQGADKGMPLATLVTQIAKAAEEDIKIEPPANSKPKPSQRRRAGPITTEGGGAQATESAAHVGMSRLDDRWPPTIRTKVGAVLLSALIDSAKMPVVQEHPTTKEVLTAMQPAFSHVTRIRKGKKLGMILANRCLVEILKREPRGDVLARYLPMVVEPKPWATFDQGGFLEYPTQLIRIKAGERDQKMYAEAAIKRGDMEQVFRGLDVLGKTSWRINRPVFDAMLTAWNSGKAFAKIPPLDPDIPLPPEPELTEDPLQRRLWMKAVKAAENQRAGLHSVRCFMNFQIEIARAFRDQTFYFPHNIDFRGRAYPMPTYLNHMGADNMRGLLVFAEGRELGEKGLHWLKVQLANVYGYDKASLQERENFATENMDKIFDSATNPLGGKRWWLQAEDPWQCLAACIEIKAAVESPDPTKFVSHLPVHQDGTCNGLQHYAALGGDTWGAEQVNLIPGDRPADVYMAVAELVQKSVKKDESNGFPLAKGLASKITRKVVKQTVMTNVYGVTYVGAKKQIHKQLDSLYPNLAAETGHPSILFAAYLAHKVFQALSTMFRGAHDIQAWLGEIGGRVCRAVLPEQIEALEPSSRFKAAGSGEKVEKKRTPKAKGKATEEGKEKATGSTKEKAEELLGEFRSTLIWTTPLRMPVVQPYRKTGSRTIKTCLQDLVLTIVDRSDPVNRRKQLQAFPPNFIHSLDASHMMLSALECSAMGLTFAAVHDSFWTHAADVDKMNGVIRDSFIRIHSEDVIGRLKAEFEARYKGALYMAIINPSSEAGKAILAHRKRARISFKDELLQEKHRQDLLRSLDPEDVKKGRAMVTPASIFEELATPDMVEPDEDAGRQMYDEDADDMDASDAADQEQAVDAAEEEELSPTLDQPGRQELPGIDELLGLVGTNFFEHKTAATTKTRKRQPKLPLWLPLSFPEIPKKGDFDVKQLKASKYFFS